MPVAITLDPTLKLIHSTLSGHLTLQELLNQESEIKALFEKGDVDIHWAQLVDMKDVDSLESPTPARVRSFARQSTWPKDCPRAVIAPGNLTYGLSRMYQMWGEPNTKNFKVFRTKTDAESYIDTYRKDNPLVL